MGRVAEFGSILLGSRSDSPTRRRLRVQILITAGVLIANAVGVGAVVLLGTVGIPNPSVFTRNLLVVDFVYVPIYITLAFLVGVLWGTMVVVRMLRWAADDRPTITARDARSVFRAPRVLTFLEAVLWVGGAGLFMLLYGLRDPDLILKVALVSLFSAAVVCAVSYLVTEFALRPYAALALAEFPTMRRRGLGIRAMVTWMLGSGVPLAGMVLVTVFGAANPETSKWNLAISVSILGATALFTGLLLTYMGTDRVGAPLRSVINGMAQVRTGERGSALAVYDGTELGELQAGFNAMVEGLAERERLRDLFGRHVGPGVVQEALQRGVQLGGETRTAGVLFVDVVGSTALAMRLAPEDVVALLNRFFAVVVGAVNRNGGLINKFEGDAALAIFGAPTALDDPAGAALTAAAEIARELGRAEIGLQAGVGVSYGEVVAGNVGAEDRYEYTVIGDPVNEAARLTELAKRDTSLPLASARAVAAAWPGVAKQWRAADTVVLRGRHEPTQLYEPLQRSRVLGGRG
ncbi:adenylate/guanylate cyclase domain-containing protein [Tsukamurella soli]|uniref:Adenylate/guanylate cyclase domain-containing protein n=1 Tax=Tsukamurella soli TaxID=644556 RepID=A0ABP8JLY0_9ACTN